MNANLLNLFPVFVRHKYIWMVLLFMVCRLWCPAAYAQTERTITGKVTTVSGEGLEGVSVRVRNTNIATSTDSEGNFNLSVPMIGGIIELRSVGFLTKAVTIGEQTTLTIALQEDISALDEVVVVGYGTQKKANLTGSVGAVSGEVLTQRPAPNAANLLQGRVTGVQVTQPSGEPGRDNPNFLIRGRSTFGGSTAPLVLIDGVTGSFNNLSPDDIENVTVLKDAASAAIYGARAANGVVLVTTKKGRSGKTIFNYHANIARHTPTALPDLITNSAEYMELYNQAAARSGVAFRYPAEEIEKYSNATDRNQYPNFDNVNYYINPATVTNHNLSVSGGGERNTFNASLSYLDQKAMIKGYNFKRYNGLLNYTNELSKAITVGTIMNLTYRDRQEPPFTGENMALAIYAAGPLYGPFLPDGSGRVVSRAYQQEGRNRNPQEYYEMGEQHTKEYNLNAQAFIDIRPFKGFAWTSKIAINYVDEYYKMYQKNYDAFLFQKDPSTDTYIRDTFGPDILGVTDQYSKVLNPTVYSTLTYDVQIEDHTFKALAGYEQIFYKNQNLRGRRINTVAPVLTDLTGYMPDGESLYFTHPRLPSLAGPSEWAMQSFFGRLNYDYKGIYLLEANLRYDGTSKVSPAYRWGLFPSISAGWLLSKEHFLQSQSHWLTELKFRGSYGTLGNQDVGTYLYQDNLVIGSIYYPFGNTDLQQGAVNDVFRDQSIRWESSSVLDFGFDFNLKNGLLGVTFDWFRRLAFNILAAPSVPASLGVPSQTINNGKMRSQGIELELTHQHRIGQVSYGANFQISTAKNKVLDIQIPFRGSTIQEVGLPYNAHFLYEWDGIFQEEDIGNPAVPRHEFNPNPRAGDLKMKDQNGDGLVNADDRIVVKGAYPDYIYSFGFNVGYKGFSLHAFFQGVQGLQARVNNWGVDPFMQGTAPTTKWRDAWTPENRSNTLPAIYIAGYSGVANYGSSTYYLQDASYLRLKNVMLSYNFSEQVVSKLKMQGLGLYFSADNLFTITDYEGGDPERTSVSGNFAQYPQARIFSLGMNVKF